VSATWSPPSPSPTQGPDNSYGQSLASIVQNGSFSRSSFRSRTGGRTGVAPVRAASERDPRLASRSRCSLCDERCGRRRFPVRQSRAPESTGPRSTADQPGLLGTPRPPLGRSHCKAKGHKRARIRMRGGGAAVVPFNSAVLLNWGRTTMAVLGVVDPAMFCGTLLMSHQVMVFPAIFCAEVSGCRWREPFIPL